MWPWGPGCRGLSRGSEEKRLTEPHSAAKRTEHLNLADFRSLKGIMLVFIFESGIFSLEHCLGVSYFSVVLPAKSRMDVQVNTGSIHFASVIVTQEVPVGCVCGI